MLPGKKYGPDDYIRILWRRKWLLLVPALVAAVGTYFYARSLPDLYRATALVMIVPQGVPPDFVRSTVDTPIGQRLQMISQQVLTRTRLESMMQDLNLYTRERQTMIMEDVVARLRANIRITPGAADRRGGGQTNFRVSFDSTDPRAAARVAEEVASLFVKENIENREVLADTTTQFLASELEGARQRLIEHEKRLEQFRRVNAGRLPTQAQSNVQMLQTAQSQLQAVNEATNRDRDRLLFLERSLVDAEAAAEAAAVAAANSMPTTRAARGPATQALEAARAALRAMETRLRPAHPDLARARRQIAELEAKADAEMLAQPLTPSPDGVNAAERAARGRVAELRKEIAQLQARIEARKADETRAQGALGLYRARLEAVPGLESDLVELMRDYSTLQETYTSLLRKSEQSKLAVNLERRQVGQQFRLIEAPRVPVRPFSPDRQRINMMGLLGGLAFGFGIAALLEYRDTTIKTDEDVVVSLSLPVLAVIPAMFTKAERTRARRRRLLAVGASVILAASGAAAAVWRQQLISVIDGWVR